MTDSSSLSTLVFGAGAIGTYIGGSLVAAGQRVTFIEQASAAAELRTGGMRLDVSIDRQRRQAAPLVIRPEAFGIASSLPEAFEQGPFDVAVFAMKSYDTALALEGIQPFADRMPPVLCLQNGVDNEALIAAALGTERILAGTVTCSIARRGPGDIVLEKARGVGIAAGHPLSRRLVGAMNAALLNARLFPHAAAMKWSKVLVNLPGSATAAILDMTPAEVFSRQDLFDLEMRLAREAQAVMAAEGVRPVNLPGVPVKILALAARLPAFLARPVMMKAVGGGRGRKMPSFHIDLHAGRRQSEVAWLHGAVARHGQQAGLPTPVSRLLTETLLAMVRGEIPIAAFSRQPEKLVRLLG
ncbi:MAG: ketopantoate reductase family protein [Anaerolineales bacterium]|nr:ketopantoate reductase family protein [Anaerolineales bacterium]